MSSVAVANYYVAFLFEIVHDVGVGQQEIGGVKWSMRWKVTRFSMTRQIKANVIELFGK